MEGYIVIRKRTLAFIVAVLIVTAALLGLWLWWKHHTNARPLPHVVVRSYNILKADGRDALFFSGMTADSTLVDLALSPKGIVYGHKVRLSGPELHSVIGYSKDSLKNCIAALESSMGEMKYYLKVHGVQDEGYDMVAVHETSTEKKIAALRQVLDALESISIRTALTTKYVAISRRIDSLWTGKDKSVAVWCNGGAWRDGRWQNVPKTGQGIIADSSGRVIAGKWIADTLVSGRRTDEHGVYEGRFDSMLRASGHGVYLSDNGIYYEGHWKDDARDGFGFAVAADNLRAGEWLANVFKGERLHYTSERIYGIDISRYQHGRGRKYYPIHWNRLRITDLGRISKKKISGKVDYPVSFIYIKSTEGSSVRNKYYRADYNQARRHGIHCGAYHFFSTLTSASEQARYFIKYSYFRSGDLPPVLDVEPTDRQIARMGGINELFNRIRVWLNIVRRHTGVRPVLYISQSFVNKYLKYAPDIKHNYNIWIARYGEYKPDIKLVYWQLCPDGRVAGIHGEVDINVFNGYHEQFERFLQTELIK